MNKLKKFLITIVVALVIVSGMSLGIHLLMASAIITNWAKFLLGFFVTAVSSFAVNIWVGQNG